VKLSQIAINAVSTRGARLEENLAAYAEAGFRNAEFPLRQLKDYLEEGNRVSDLVRLLEGHKMRCIGGFETIVECFSPAAARAANHAKVMENRRTSDT